MSLGLRFALWLSRRLGNPRVIYGSNPDDKYLSRFYLLGRPRSGRFDGNGDPSNDIEWSQLPIGIYLHHFHRGDEDRELHNHPWKWAVSLILSGGYMEERRVGNGSMFSRKEPGMLNLITSKDFHRVIIHQLGHEPTWTLFVVGPKFQGWGFWDRATDKFTPWREFLNAKRLANANSDHHV